MSNFISIISSFFKTIIVLMLILICISIVYYTTITSSIKRGIRISRFQSHVFSDPIRSKILGLDRGHNLYYAIENRYIPSTIMVK